MLNKKVRKERRCQRNSYNVVRKNLENQRLDRICIHISNRYLLLQLIDINGNCKVTMSSNQKKFDELSLKKDAKLVIKSYNKQGAFLVGEMMGNYMKEHNIKNYVVDRRSYKFHGKVEAAINGVDSIIGDSK